jgi:hypothetical protein
VVFLAFAAPTQSRVLKNKGQKNLTVARVEQGLIDVFLNGFAMIDPLLAWYTKETRHSVRIWQRLA